MTSKHKCAASNISKSDVLASVHEPTCPVALRTCMLPNCSAAKLEESQVPQLRLKRHTICVICLLQYELQHQRVEAD